MKDVWKIFGPAPLRRVAVGGVLCLLVGAFVVNDLRSDVSGVRTFFDHVGLSFPQKLERLSEKQKEDLRNTLTYPNISLKEEHTFRVYFRDGCRVCRQNATMVSEIVNTIAGWKVGSMGALIEPDVRRGLILEVYKETESATEGINAIKEALMAAQIPFRVEKTRVPHAEDFSLFFGE